MKNRNELQKWIKNKFYYFDPRGIKKSKGIVSSRKKFIERRIGSNPYTFRREFAAIVLQRDAAKAGFKRAIELIEQEIIAYCSIPDGDDFELKTFYGIKLALDRLKKEIGFG